MKYRPFILLTALVLALGTAARPDYAAPSVLSPEDEYYRLRQRGDYAEALKSLQAWTAGLDDPAAVMANLHRVRELLAYPELYEQGMQALAGIEAKALCRDPFVKDHIDRIRAFLLLTKGETQKAEAIMTALSLLDFYASGPFSGGSGEEFERSRAPEKETGTVKPRGDDVREAGWFTVAPDRIGVLDFNDLFPGMDNPLFYLSRSISIPRPGEYYLILGTTGFTDLWLDGAKIFSERTEHGFSHDQYFIRVSLSRGAHRLLVKAGNSAEGIRFSLRIASIDGTRIRVPSLREDGAGAESPGTLLAVGYFPALVGLMKTSDAGPDVRYLIGYLLHAARLGGAGGRAIDYLSSLPEGHPRRSSARFYMAGEEKDAVAKERLLRQSLQADQKNLESLRELALLKIERDFIYEASPLIEEIYSSSPASRWYRELMTRLYLRAGQGAEAGLRADALKSSPYPSYGFSFGSLIYLAEGDYFHAKQDLERLIRLDRFDRASYLSLLDCHEKTGDHENAEGLLTQLIHLYPNSVVLKLRLARAIEARRGPGPSIPCLAAALEAAPGNRDVLRSLGLAYHKMGNKGLAVYYLGLALDRDPGDESLRRYLGVIRDGDDESGKRNGEKKPAGRLMRKERRPAR